MFVCTINVLVDTISITKTFSFSPLKVTISKLEAVSLNILWHRTFVHIMV
jgi:hypothetical protein